MDYRMRISRRTVDKLGVKLYDKVSAVIAELISNSYDADATEVTVRAPMGKSLSSAPKGKVNTDEYKIEVVDNGIGMIPAQMQKYFLVIGSDRRDDGSRGALSPKFNRKVMGRKGVGKLAPFGVCKRIEIISSGGDKISRTENGMATKGYLASHIILDYDAIIDDGEISEKDYKPETGELDGTLQNTTGTRVILSSFNKRSVPKIGVLARQIAQRFGITSENWKVKLEDNTKTIKDDDFSMEVGQFDIDTMSDVQINFQPDNKDGQKVTNANNEPITKFDAGFYLEGTFYAVKGWVAYLKKPFKDELMEGVRIYCRGKIAAQTPAFGRGAGFTGEYSVRSYLVGELHADWLDDEEDLIQTDRKDILWSHELGAKFQEWGQEVVKHIAQMSRGPMRKSAEKLFFETGKVAERIEKEFPTPDMSEVRKHANKLASTIGRSISRREAEDPDTVDDFVRFVLTLAPHDTLNVKLNTASETDLPLSTINQILRSARIAELSSFGLIAEKRVKVIDSIERHIENVQSLEKSLQELIESAPWLINPEWAPVTANQSLNTLRKGFANYYKKKTNEDLFVREFGNGSIRPDFVLTSQEGKIQIVEIKSPSHVLNNDEMDRIAKYYSNLKSFLNDEGNTELRKDYSDFHITLVCDEISLDFTRQGAYDGYVNEGRLRRINWESFLSKTKKVHQDFLKERERQKEMEQQSTND